MFLFQFLAIFFLLNFTEFAPTTYKNINTEIKLVQILFRHGDRSAVNSYPTDIYNETIWDKYGGKYITKMQTYKNKFYFKFEKRIWSTDPIRF